jgi:hypothetical protein
MDKFHEAHLVRLYQALHNAYSLDTIPEWIVQNTYLNGRKYSFKDHEYQLAILRDPSPQQVIMKASQLGLSELEARWALAMCNIMPGFTTLMTLMTAHFASQFMRTRVDPIIQDSPTLHDNLQADMDNADLKRFLNNSFLYLKGSQSSNAALSVPVDALIHDELDASSPEIITTYQSRLTHSPWKLKTWLSTPTLPGLGIDAEFQKSRRHFEHLKCSHCGWWFIPDYHQHVKIPGFTGALEEITKNSLPENYNDAYVECPKCGERPDFAIENREWVCENPEDTHLISSGHHVSPFCAPAFISPGYLVQASTQYNKRTLFLNQNLGLPAEDAESTLMLEDLLPCLIEKHEIVGASYVMGVDMGNVCHIVILAVDGLGQCTEVYSERCPVTRVVERRKELAQAWRCRITLMDSLPMAETVYRAQLGDSNVYGAVFTNLKSLETHTVKMRDQDADEGIVNLRQVNLNRNRALDAMLDFVRTRQYQRFHNECDQEWLAHMQSMKRVKEYGQDGELQYVWRKTTGTDHWFFALLYAMFAARIIGVAVNPHNLPITLGKFKVEETKLDKGGFFGKNPANKITLM